MRLLLVVLFLSGGYAQEPQDPQQVLIESQRKENSVLSKLEEIGAQLSSLKKETELLELEQADLLVQQSQQRNEIHRLTLDYQSKESHLLSRMKTLYKIHRRGLARVIFGAENPVELRRRSTYLMSLIKADKQQLIEFKKLARQKKETINKLTNSQKRLDSLQFTLEKQKQQLQEQQQDQKNYLLKIRDEKRLARQLIREINQSRQQLQMQLPSNTSKTNFSSMYGKLPWPVRGKLIRRFGKQIDPITGKSVQSLGIDIQAPMGTPVACVASGVVTLAQFIPAYGHTVAVSHGNYSTIYAHLNGISVQQGQEIPTGTVVGQVGNTGLTNQNNQALLTFEIRYNKTPQNPLPWLRSQ